jgi:hypothetical protein
VSRDEILLKTYSGLANHFHVFLYSSDADRDTLKRIFTKLATASVFESTSILSALIDLDLAPRIMSCIDPKSGDMDLEMALHAASLIASMMSVNNRCNKERKRSEVFGQSVDKVGEGLGKLLRENLWP